MRDNRQPVDGWNAASVPSSGRLARWLPSPVQRQLWLEAHAGRRHLARTVSRAYRMRGPVSIQQLSSALRSVAARHDALRTILSESDGQLWRVAQQADIDVRTITAVGYQEALTIANHETQEPFDLAKGPLTRFLVISVNEADCVGVLTAHRAIADERSMGLIWREILQLQAGHDLSMPESQYSDWIDRQDVWLRGPQADRQREFWHRYLSSDLPPLDLESIASMAAGQPGPGGTGMLRLDAEARRDVGELARRYGVTDHAVLIAAFAAVLHRYTLQSQITIAIEVPGSMQAGYIVGNLANAVPLRLQVRPDQRFYDLLGSASYALSEVLQFQQLPWPEIAGLSASAARRPGDLPWQAALALAQEPETGVRRYGLLSVERVPLGVIPETGDIRLLVEDAVTEACCDRTGADAAFRAGEAGTWLNSVSAVLADSARRPSASLCELLLLPPHLSEQRVRVVNSGYETYDDLQFIHAAFESAAEREPDLIAIQAGDLRVSYGELNRRANWAAHQLVKAGAGPERLVGIYAERSADLIVGMLATLKAGSGFVPLDPRQPTARLALIVRSAKLAAVVTQDHLRGKAAELAVPVVVCADHGVTEPPAVAISLENTACVYFTSGSTGQPKGVVLDHRCVGGRLAWLLQRYKLQRADRLIHKTPLIFDVAICEIFGPLSSGATILMAAPGAEADISHIGELMTIPGTLFVHFVPSMLKAYLDFAPEQRRPDLRWVQVSGEAVPARLLERFAERFTSELHNMYGQTETSEVAGWEGREYKGRGGVPIGRPVGIYRIFILDEALNLVPPGVPGELCVAGVGGLARGYLGDPALTAERFVPNPYPVKPGERLYRTGDRGVVGPDGLMRYLGRADEQVKIRGCRVEPREVEAVLSRHPQVRDCVVRARQDEWGDTELVAYLVGGELLVDDVATHAEDLLPGYMLPAVYVRVDAFPLTPSGKLDALALPAPARSDRQARVTDDPPVTHVERELAELFKQLLDVSQVGRHDDFFAVGGNSLKCLQILNRINSVFGVNISVREFFGNPTVAGLASEIERSLAETIAAMSESDVANLVAELDRSD